MFARLSLRARLLLGVVALVATGLIVADAATYTSLRSFLFNRVDSALTAGHLQVEHSAGGHGDGPQHGDGHGPHAAPVAGVDWYQVRTTAGVVTQDEFLVGDGSPPKLPNSLNLPSGTSEGGERVSYFTVHSEDGSQTYRVRASIDADQPQEILVVAASLDDALGTLHHLLLIELLVTALVLTAIVGVGLWVVRLGLRPLREIEATAAAIAAGDLSQRVQRAEPRTEVGRLGLSLNAMLGQIETAFREQQASEARLRRFVADASHELRTPLTSVRAYAELYERGAAERPEDLARSMTGIARESERMTVLVEDLLLLARLDEGRPLERQSVDLANVVVDAVDAARVVDSERPIELRVEPLTVTGDRDRLRQAIDNLLSNVRSHTPPRTPVSVELARSNGHVQLTVSDSGPGFDAEHATHVFERFYRADPSRSRGTGGVGLGLSIVAAVVEAHGGSASTRPTPGGGATFVVALPLVG